MKTADEWTKEWEEILREARHASAMLALQPDSQLTRDELRARQQGRYKRRMHLEDVGVEEVRREWRVAAQRTREARRIRARKAYAKRAAALKLIRELETKGMGALL